ncbi:MAG: 5-(carboxyamino)imidazole ribonucleotide mutase [Thermoplasmata archaeon]
MDVQIFAGSTSDIGYIKELVEVLKELDISYDVKIISAHRNPMELMKIIKESEANVFIAIAGLSAALPGFISSLTLKPVIGIPLSGKVPLDSLLSMVQMPKGVPIGVVGIDNVKNGALLAARIISLYDAKVRENLKNYIKKENDKALESGKKALEDMI